MLTLVNVDKLHTHSAYGAYAIARSPADASHDPGAVFTATVEPDGRIVIRKYTDLKKDHVAAVTLEQKASRPPALCVRDEKLYLVYREGTDRSSGSDKKVGFSWVHLRHEITNEDEWHHHTLDGVDGDLKYEPGGFVPTTDSRPSLVGHGGEHDLFLACKSNSHTISLGRYNTGDRRWHWKKNDEEVIKEIDIYRKVAKGKTEPLQRGKLNNFLNGVRPIDTSTIKGRNGELTEVGYWFDRQEWTNERNDLKSTPKHRRTPEQNERICELQYELDTDPRDNYFHTEKGPALASAAGSLYLGFKDNHRADPGDMNPLLWASLTGTWPPNAQNPWTMRCEGHSYNHEAKGDIGPGTRVAFPDKESPILPMVHYGPALASYQGEKGKRVYLFYANREENDRLCYGVLDLEADTGPRWDGGYFIDLGTEPIVCHGAPTATEGNDHTLLVSFATRDGSQEKARLLELKVE